MKYSHLLGIKWSVMNCGQVASKVLQMLGMDEAAAHVPVNQESAARVLFSEDEVWRQVSTSLNAAEVGDLIASAGDDGDWHVSAVVKPGLAITSAKGVGVFATPVSRIKRSWGVYRFQGAQRD